MSSRWPMRLGHALEEPDVRDRHGQLDVAEPLAAHLRLRHLDAAAVADHAAVADALVLAAVALPVLDRTEDLLAEQAVLLRLERAVVDRLRLGHLAVRPAADDLRRGEPDADRIERRLRRCSRSSSASGSACRATLRGDWRLGVLRHGALLARPAARSPRSSVSTARPPRTGRPDRGSGVP